MGTIEVDKKTFSKQFFDKPNHWLAAYYGVSEVTINNWARKYGLYKQKRGNLNGIKNAVDIFRESNFRVMKWFDRQLTSSELFDVLSIVSDAKSKNDGVEKLDRYFEGLS